MPPKKEEPKKTEQPKKEEKKVEQPKKVAEQPKKEAPKKVEQPKKTETKKEEPKKTAEQPKKAAEQPKKAAETKKEAPKKAAEAPKKAAESAKKVVPKKSSGEATKAKAAATPAKAAKATKDVKRKAESTSEQPAKKQKTLNAETIVGAKKPRNFSIGNDIQPKRDLTRFVKWPRYILMQRQRRVLQHRLKVPPSINQFTKTLDTNTAANLFKLLNKYRPEDHAGKVKRLIKIAQGRARIKNQKPLTVKCGINHVTKLVEEKKAALVVIAHDVDPIELVLYLPALCRKQGIPYCFVKGKSRLGQLVRHKTATAVAIKGVKTEDKQEFAQLISVIRANYNDKYEEMKRKWGGGIMGLKSQAVTKQREKVKKQEEKKKAIKFK